MWNLKKGNKQTYLQNRNGLTNKGNKLMAMKGKKQKKDKLGVWG